MKVKALSTLVLLMLTSSFASAQAITRCGGPTNALQTNWPTFQFDDCRTGYNPYESKLNAGNVQNLALAWQYTGVGYVTGAPVLANGMLYFGSYAPSSIRAVNAVTGAWRWQYPIAGDGVDGSSPAVVNGVLYLGAGDGTVYALNANTGALIWKFATAGTIVGSSPAVTNGVVYIGSADHNMYALNAKTGALLWKYNTSELVEASAAVVNGIVYFATTSGNLYALNAGNGTLLWKYAVGGNPRIYPPTVINGVLFFGDGDVYAIDALAGVLLWHNTFVGVAVEDIAVANGVVYAVAHNFDPEHIFPTVYAFDGKTGTQLWKSAPHPGIQGVVAANGVLYAMSSGSLLVIDASTGNFVTTYPLGASTSPIVANGFVYLGWSQDAQHGGLYAYHRANQ